MISRMRQGNSPKSQGGSSLSVRRIDGRHNQMVRELRKAFSRSEPGDGGVSAIEGWKIVEEAIRSGLKFEAVFFSESSKLRAEKLLPQFGGHVERLLLPNSLFASAVPTENSQGVAALVHRREFRLDEILAQASIGPILGVEGIQDPGNLGTILRSAEAFGAAGVLLGESTVSAFNWKAVRASAGSVFRLPAVKVKLREVLSQLRGRGLKLFATSSHKGIRLDEADLNVPAAIFIGSEGEGLARDLLKEMDGIIEIPHSPRVESLNAGVAASIVLYEAARQRSRP